MELEHGSQDWLLWRTRGIGSSDAPVLAGVSPWKDVYELWSEKVTGESKVKDNWAMQRGRDLEAVARDIFEFEYGCLVPPRNLVHPKYAFIKASLDGLCEAENYLVEFKAPGKADLELAKLGVIPDKYYAQVQWQLLVSGCKFGMYVCYDGKTSLYPVKVFPNQRYIKNLVRLARWFWHKVENKIEITTEYKIKLRMPTVQIREGRP